MSENPLEVDSSSDHAKANAVEVTLNISTWQLALLARAIEAAISPEPTEIFLEAEAEELELLKGCCNNAANDPDPSIIYGFNH